MEKLVGKWVKRVWVSDYGFTKDRWYQVELEYTSSGYKLTNNKGEIYGSYPSSDNTYFDFANPCGYNPNKEILLGAGDVVTIDAGIVKYNLMKYLSVQSKLDHLKNYQSYIKIIIGVLKSKYDFIRNFNAVLDYLDLNHYKAGLVLEDITIRTQCSIPQPVVYINGEVVGDRAIITQAMLDEEVANKVSPNEDDKLCTYTGLIELLYKNGISCNLFTENGFGVVRTRHAVFKCSEKWVTLSGVAEFLTVGQIKEFVAKYGRAKLELMQATKEQPKTVPTTADNILEVLAYNGWYKQDGWCIYTHAEHKDSCVCAKDGMGNYRANDASSSISTPNFDLFMAFLTSITPLKELPVEVDYLSAVQSGWWVKATKTVGCDSRDASNRIYSKGITSGEYYQVVHLHYKQQNKPSCVEIVDNGSNTWFYGLDYFDWSTAVADKPSK